MPLPSVNHSAARQLGLTFPVALAALVLTACGTPMHNAAMANDTAEMRRLIASGVPVNQTMGLVELTPLQVAAGHGAYEAVRLLLESGADVSADRSKSWNVSGGAENPSRAFPERIPRLFSNRT